MKIIDDKYDPVGYTKEQEKFMLTLAKKLDDVREIHVGESMGKKFAIFSFRPYGRGVPYRFDMDLMRFLTSYKDFIDISGDSTRLTARFKK